MLIKKFLHISLSLLLLVSTMGLTINKHYSNNELFSTSIFVEAEGCCEIPCGCCDEESTFVQVKEDYIPSSLHLDNISSLFVIHTILEFQFIKFSTFFESSNIIANNISPPKPGDYISLIQSFLL